MAGRRAWWLVTVVVLTLLRPVAAAEPTVPSGLQELEGHWVYAGGQKERQERLDAIDRTVSQMSFFIRFIARRMIRKATAIPSSYTIAVDGHEVTVRKDDDPGVATGWEGQALQLSDGSGDTATVTRQWKDGALASHLQRPRGSGTEVMRPEAGGTRMSVKVTVASSHLPSDITFTLTYRKKVSGGD